MHKLLLGATAVSVLFLSSATPALSQVNCGIIQKDLDRGVTPKDIAELKGISIDDVKKCQEAKKAAPAAPAAAPAAAEKPGTAGGGPAPGGH
jgi:hypothetical protein